MNINEKIRLFREDHQLSQEDMANKLSMSTKGYAKIERGETRVNFERLEQILSVFNIDIYELLTYGEKGTFYINKADNNTNSQISLGNGNQEIDKLNLMLSHKDELLKLKEEIIIQKDLLIEHLKNELSLLKNNI